MQNQKYIPCALRRIWIVSFNKSLLFVSLMLIICGCGMVPGVSMVADRTHDFNFERATIFMKNPPPDIMKTAAEVGQFMGYRLNSQITSELGSPYSNMVIQLESKTSRIGSLVTAYQKENTIQVMRTPDGLQIEVRTVGTFGAGSEKNAKKILAEYKEKLMDRLALH
jgi:hypothetical protein